MLEILKKEDNLVLPARLTSKPFLFGLWVLGTIPVVAILMLPSIGYPLITDDFWWLYYARPGGYRPYEYFNTGHYSPTIQVLLGIWYRLFDLNGVPYHLLSVGVYWLAIIATALFIWKLTSNQAIGLIAGSIMLINSQPAQAYVWAVGIWYPFSTLFFILGFWGYLIAISSKGRRAVIGYSAFILGLVLSIFTHEQGWTLVAVTFLHSIIFIDQPGKKPLREVYSKVTVFKRALFFITPTLLTLGAIVGRFILLKGQAGPVLVEFPVYEAWNSIIRAYIPGLSRTGGFDLTLSLTEKFAPGKPGIRLVLFLVQYTVLVVIFIFVRAKYKFYIIWSALQTIALLYALGFLFPRHFYLAIIPACILWAYLLYNSFNWVKQKLAQTELAPRIKQTLLTILVIIPLSFFFLSQLPEHQSWNKDWGIAAEISSRSFASIKKIAAANPIPDKLLILNLPDTLIASNAEWIGVFNAGTAQAVNLMNPGRFTNIVVAKTPLDQYPIAGSSLPLDLTQPHLKNLYFGVGTDVTFEQVKTFLADPTYLVVYYDIKATDVVQINKVSG